MNLRENIKKELRLLTEQTNVYHRWQGACSTTTGIVNFYMGGNQNTPQTNQNFYQQVGSPSVGETVGNFSPPNYWSAGSNQCYTYLGSSPNPQGGSHGAYNVSGWDHTLWHGPYPAGYSNCLVCYGATQCDTTPASACAQQWFANPAPTWATSFMSSNDCTTYTWFANNLEQDAIDIMNDPTTPSPQPGPYNDWNDIKNAANASGLGQPEKGQFKRKMAKAKYSQCQIQACNC